MDLRAPGGSNRHIIGPSGATGWGNTPQESSIWYANGRYNLIFTGAGALQYTYCLAANDPCVAASWSVPVAVIGGGAGGFAGSPARSGLLVDGATLYVYFLDMSNQTDVYVATAALATPTSFTTVGIVRSYVAGSAYTGNIIVVKDGATYRMFLEAVLGVDYVGGGSIVSGAFVTGLHSSATPTGTFTQDISVLQTLRVGREGKGSASGMWIGKEGATWVAYYHGQAWAPGAPDQLYRATTTNLATDSWTVDSGGSPPFMRRVHRAERDQVSDPFLVQSPGGTWYMTWEGYDNTTAKASLFCAALQPALKQWDGNRWQLVESTAGPIANELPDVAPTLQEVARPWMGADALTGSWAYDSIATPVGSMVRYYNWTVSQNDSAAWDVRLSPGVWKLRVAGLTDPNCAIVSVEIDGGSGSYPFSASAVPSGPHGTVDFYSPSIDVLIGEVTLNVYGDETIEQRLRFQAASKNPSAGGYLIMLLGFQLQRIGSL